ncbi:hypothetical protein IIA15_00260 [candidate division TA06 bacterium]|nr:hypothetical protein [candidate division TA06 bacterium]
MRCKKCGIQVERLMPKRAVCYSCSQEYFRDYREKNRELLLKKGRQSRSIKNRENPGALKENLRLWYEKNRVKILKERKIYYLENREAMLTCKAKYRKRMEEEHPGRYKALKKIAVKMAIDNLEDSYIINLLNRSTNLLRSDFPKGLIELKRQQVLAKRQLTQTGRENQ